MIRIAALALAASLSFTLAPPAAAAAAHGAVQAEGEAFAATGPHSVTTSLDVWTDEARGRDIPVKIYQPDGPGPFAAVIFSHGLGGSREAAGYLGAHLASWGLVAIHIQHPGSDEAIWAGVRDRRTLMAAMQAAVREPRNAIDRYQDIPFVVDAIEARAQALSVDPARLGVAGHSFGAHTVMAAAGINFPTPRGDLSLAEPRLSAGLMLSPPAPNERIDPSDYARIYGGITIPLLHVTGVDDGSPLDPGLDPSDRLIPFVEIGGAPQYLAVFDPGDHQVFGGRAGPRGAPDWYAGVQAATAQIAAAFFRAELYDDPLARAFMDGPGFTAALDGLAQSDRKQ